jgi:signal transduction histidine kinase
MTIESTIIDRVNAGVFSVNATHEVLQWNLFMATNTGRRAEDVVGRNLFDCFPELPRSWLTWKIRTVFELGTHAFSTWRHRPYVFRLPHNRPLTGGIDCMRQDVAFIPTKGSDDSVASVCVVISDATDTALSHAALERAHADLKHEMEQHARLEMELRLAQKLESIGQLAAGVAHEINTPLQFVGDTVTFLEEAFASLIELVNVYRADDNRSEEARRAEARSDIEYFTSEVPLALGRAADGMQHISHIVSALRSLSHPDSGVLTTADLNEALQHVIVVTRNETKFVADVETDLGELPSVNCYPGEINQVFINLIVNAAHAIQAKLDGGGGRGVIQVSSRCEGTDVVIAIRDTGCGIPPALRDRIFDPFFTTKPVGKGTGQGLSIARAAVARHHGALTFESEEGVGTTFLLRLPIGSE